MMGLKCLAKREKDYASQKYRDIVSIFTWDFAVTRGVLVGIWLVFGVLEWTAMSGVQREERRPNLFFRGRHSVHAHCNQTKGNAWIATQFHFVTTTSPTTRKKTYRSLECPFQIGQTLYWSSRHGRWYQRSTPSCRSRHFQSLLFRLHTSLAETCCRWCPMLVTDSAGGLAWRQWDLLSICAEQMKTGEARPPPRCIPLFHRGYSTARWS